MAWEVHRLVNEEGLTILGPYRTHHMAMWYSEKDARMLERCIEKDTPVWYEFVEVPDGV
jgi:hypothetical protein